MPLPESDPGSPIQGFDSRGEPIAATNPEQNLPRTRSGRVFNSAEIASPLYSIPENYVEEGDIEWDEDYQLVLNLKFQYYNRS